MKIHIDRFRNIWLSYEYLKEYGISERTIEKWKTFNVGIRKYIEGRIFVKYDTIPKKTYKRLPSEKVLRHEER
jgi:hypothetical protein